MPIEIKQHKLKVLLPIVLVVILLVVGVLVYVNRLTPAKKTIRYSNSLNEASRLNVDNKHSNAINATNQAISYSQNTQQKANAYFYQAYVYSQEGQSDKALTDYLKVESFGSQYGSVDTLATIAYLYSVEGDKTQAISYYDKAIALAKSNHNPIDAANIPNYDVAIQKLGGTP